MNMQITLKSSNNTEFPVEVRFGSDGLWVVWREEVIHFNELTKENKKIVIRHFMSQASEAING